MNKVKKVVVCLLVAVLCMASINISSLKASAATNSYEKYDLSDGNAVKVGSYYLKYKNGNVYASKKKATGFKKTGIDNFVVWSNGKDAYFIKDIEMSGEPFAKSYLAKYTFSTKKTKKLKYLCDCFAGDNSIAAFKNGRFYINLADDGLKVAVYNIKTKKLTKPVSGLWIKAAAGNYLLLNADAGYSVDSYETYLYKYTTKGLKKVKKQSKAAMSVTAYEGKFYYAEYPSRSNQKTATLYCCKANGTSKKKLGTFSADAYVVITNITGKTCMVVKDSSNYTYTYKTKELTPCEY